MDSLQGRDDVDEALFAAYRFGDRIDDGFRRQRVEHETDRGLYLPAGDRLRRAVNGDDRTSELLSLLVLSVLPQQEVLRVSQLSLRAVRTHRAREQTSITNPQLALAPGLIEEGDDQRISAVADEDLQHRATLAAHPTGGYRCDVRDDGDVIPVGEPGDRRQFPAFCVPSRIVT